MLKALIRELSTVTVDLSSQILITTGMMTAYKLDPDEYFTYNMFPLSIIQYRLEKKHQYPLKQWFNL